MNAFKVGDVTATGQELKSSVGVRQCLEKLAEIDKISLQYGAIEDETVQYEAINESSDTEGNTKIDLELMVDEIEPKKTIDAAVKGGI